MLTWLVIAGLQWGPAFAVLYLGGFDELMTDDPSLPMWLACAVGLWLGTALSVMAWGAAGVHWRRMALRLDLHLRGLFATGADALLVTNLTFALLGLFYLLRAGLASVPFVGAAIAGTLGLYWAFILPHFVGLLFRKHAEKLHEIYEA